MVRPIAMKEVIILLQDNKYTSFDFTELKEHISHMSAKECEVRMEQIDEMYRPFHGDAYLISKFHEEDPIRYRLLYEEYYLLALRRLELDPWVPGTDRTGTTKYARMGYGNRKKVIKTKKAE